MPNGHLQDPRLNSTAKGFGLLSSDILEKDGRSKTILYLKDEGSKYLLAGTPVTFDLEERQVYLSKDNLSQLVTIELATNVRVDEEKIKEYPNIHKLYISAKKILGSKNKNSQG
jgi:hypothetical protein